MSSAENSAVCGRRGCGKKVMSGMLCEKCETWYHEKCTGLRTEQYESLESNENAFICMACSLDLTKIAPASPSPLAEPLKCDSSTNTDECLTLSGSTRPTDTSKELTELLYNFQQTTFNKLTELREEICALRDLLPSVKAAERSLLLSEKAVLQASKSLQDSHERGRRVILWGTFDYKLDPRQYTQNILKQILGTQAPTCFAEWLRSKATQKIKGILVHLPSVNDAKLILTNTSKLIKTSPTIKNVSPDRPLSQRLKSARKITSPPTLQTDKLDLTPIVPITPLQNYSRLPYFQSSTTDTNTESDEDTDFRSAASSVNGDKADPIDIEVPSRQKKRNRRRGKKRRPAKSTRRQPELATPFDPQAKDKDISTTSETQRPRSLLPTPPKNTLKSPLQYKLIPNCRQFNAPSKSNSLSRPRALLPTPPHTPKTLDFRFLKPQNHRPKNLRNEKIQQTTAPWMYLSFFPIATDLKDGRITQSVNPTAPLIVPMFPHEPVPQHFPLLTQSPHQWVQ